MFVCGGRDIVDLAVLHANDSAALSDTDVRSGLSWPYLFVWLHGSTHSSFGYTPPHSRWLFINTRRIRLDGWVPVIGGMGVICGADIDKACVTACGVLYFFLLYQAEALFVESVILNHSSQLPRSERLIIH